MLEIFRAGAPPILKKDALRLQSVLRSSNSRRKPDLRDYIPRFCNTLRVDWPPL